jgi:alkanesulfonate monooxygenase SsuD/methylene tetrahydromethanopterin reductase-like flavin-dependent oxidoreductase (luciferase family)
LREEFEDHGHSARERVAVVRETVELMRALWTDDEAEYNGHYRRLSRSHSWPKPLQRPYLPVLLGAPASERNFARIAEWADGWIPMGSPLLDDGFATELDSLRRAWETAGRDPGKLRLTVIQWPVGSDGLQRAFERAAALGVERVLLYMGDDGEPDALRILDATASALDLR